MRAQVDMKSLLSLVCRIYPFYEPKRDRVEQKTGSKSPRGRRYAQIWRNMFRASPERSLLAGHLLGRLLLIVVTFSHNFTIKVSGSVFVFGGINFS